MAWSALYAHPFRGNHSRQKRWAAYDVLYVPKKSRGLIMEESVVMGLSGGMDSATLLGLLIEQDFNEIHCCSFYYGSTHNKYELEAANKLIAYYWERIPEIEIYHHKMDISSVMSSFTSALLKSCDSPIPEGHYSDVSMVQTVVPGRNTIFAAIMMGLAESMQSSYIALGVHSGDHHIYPDCRPEYVKTLDALVYMASDKQVEVLTPFLHDTKKTILELGYLLNVEVPYHLTRTCYKNQPLSCGVCGACNERLEAYSLLGIADPIPYAFPYRGA